MCKKVAKSFGTLTEKDYLCGRNIEQKSQLYKTGRVIMLYNTFKKQEIEYGYFYDEEDA